MIKIFRKPDSIELRADASPMHPEVWMTELLIPREGRNVSALEVLPYGIPSLGTLTHSFRGRDEKGELLCPDLAQEIMDPSPRYREQFAGEFTSTFVDLGEALIVSPDSIEYDPKWCVKGGKRYDFGKDLNFTDGLGNDWVKSHYSGWVVEYDEETGFPTEVLGNVPPCQEHNLPGKHPLSLMMMSYIFQEQVIPVLRVHTEDYRSCFHLNMKFNSVDTLGGVGFRLTSPTKEGLLEKIEAYEQK